MCLCVTENELPFNSVSFNHRITDNSENLLTYCCSCCAKHFANSSAIVKLTIIWCLAETTYSGICCLS